MDKAFTFTAVGLAYDVFGIVILGYAFFSKSVEAMMVESGSYYGGNDALLRSLIESRTDGAAGTLLLVAGFIFQFLGSLGSASEVTGKALLIVLAFTIALYFVFLRNWFVSSQVSRGQALRKQQLEGSSTPDDSG